MDIVRIVQSKNGGWFAKNEMEGTSTEEAPRKTRKGAIGDARRRWGKLIVIIPEGRKRIDPDVDDSLWRSHR